jgi:hypothetical protein
MSALNKLMGRGIIPPLVHGLLDYPLAAVLIVLPFIVGFSSHTTALVVYLVVGGGGLLATLATRWPLRMQAAHEMTLREAA